MLFRPFVTDCNTLYVGGRRNALDHLDSAYANGYNPFATRLGVAGFNDALNVEAGLVGVDGELVG